MLQELNNTPLAIMPPRASVNKSFSEQLEGYNFNDIKQDYIVPASRLELAPHGVGLKLFNKNTLELTKLDVHAAKQILSSTSLPTTLVDKLTPSEVAELVNRRLHKISDRLVRNISTDNGQLLTRAIFSDQYRILDNEHLLEALGNVVNSDWTLGSISHNAHLLDVTFTTGKQVAARPGDISEIGFHLRNSETGFSSVAVGYYLKRLICSNGMHLTIGDATINIVHRGTFGDSFAGLHCRLDDYFKNHNEDRQFDIVSRIMQDSVEQKIDRDRIVDLTAGIDGVYRDINNRSLPPASLETAANYFIAENDYTAYGLSQAINFTAHDLKFPQSAEPVKTSGRIVEDPTKYVRIFEDSAQVASA